MNLKYGYIWPNSKALGPGFRYVIWTQGCYRRCFRCASPELQPIGEGASIDIEILAQRIVDARDIDGVTITGGEPLIQTKELSSLLSKVHHDRPELTIILFTGYKLEELNTENFRSVLKYVDVLIDGEYIDDLNDNKGLRGSSNQTIYFLTSRLEPYKEILNNGNRFREIHVLSESELLTIGIADKIVN